MRVRSLAHNICLCSPPILTIDSAHGSRHTSQVVALPAPNRSECFIPSASEGSLGPLSQDLFLECLSFLDARSLHEIQLVCHSWRTALHSDSASPSLKTCKAADRRMQTPSGCSSAAAATLWFWCRRLAMLVGPERMREVLMTASPPAVRLRLVQGLLTLHHASVARLGAVAATEWPSRNGSLLDAGGCAASWKRALHASFASLVALALARPSLVAAWAFLTIIQVLLCRQMWRDERAYHRAKRVAGVVLESFVLSRVTDSGFSVYSPHVRVALQPSPIPPPSIGISALPAARHPSSSSSSSSSSSPSLPLVIVDQLTAFARRWVSETMTRAEARAELRRFPRGARVDVFVEPARGGTATVAGAGTVAGAFLTRRRNLSDSHFFAFVLFSLKAIVYGQLLRSNRTAAVISPSVGSLVHAGLVNVRLAIGRRVRQCADRVVAAIRFAVAPPTAALSALFSRGAHSAEANDRLRSANSTAVVKAPVIGFSMGDQSRDGCNDRLALQHAPPVFFHPGFQAWAIALPCSAPTLPLSASAAAPSAHAPAAGHASNGNGTSCHSERSFAPADCIAISTVLAIDWSLSVVVPVLYFVWRSLRTAMPNQWTHATAASTASQTLPFRLSLIEHVVSPVILLAVHGVATLLRGHLGIDWLSEWSRARRLKSIFAASAESHPSHTCLGSTLAAATLPKYPLSSSMRTPLRCFALVPSHFKSAALLSASALRSLARPVAGRRFEVGVSFQLTRVAAEEPSRLLSAHGRGESSSSSSLNHSSAFQSTFDGAQTRRHLRRTLPSKLRLSVALYAREPNARFDLLEVEESDVHLDFSFEGSAGQGCVVVRARGRASLGVADAFWASTLQFRLTVRLCERNPRTHPFDVDGDDDDDDDGSDGAISDTGEAADDDAFSAEGSEPSEQGQPEPDEGDPHSNLAAAQVLRECGPLEHTIYFL
jgi:hypothetical protein